MTAKPISRRKLLKDSAKAAIAGTLFMNLPATLMAGGNSRSKVVLIRDPRVVRENGDTDGDIINRMLDEAVVELTGRSSVQDAWSAILRPDDVLGIKTNVWARLRTPVELEQGIRRHAMDIGIRDEDISILDRGVINDPVFKRATALINVRPMRTHAWSGVGTLIKNYIMFTGRPSALHPDSCADLAETWFYPQVKGKTRLNILVMLTPLFHGVGPHHFNREYTWNYGGLLVGFDPVAVDTIGVRIIQAKRREYYGEDRPINPPPKHIMVADTKFGLGTADPAKIELVRLGHQENALI
ncbi:MAG TPA: DUF362 domain-containing protein [Bacteroidetes bacterium]|nr:DUF362 domain-containing protein [Bacteroidota bacterium]